MDTKKFRTRQEFFTNETHPHGNDYIIGLDMGYSGIKVMYESGHFCIPSYVIKIENGMLDIGDDKDIFYRDADSDDLYMVGYNAQNMIDYESTNDTQQAQTGRRKIKTKEFKIQLNVALAIASEHKKEANRQLFVETGLPAAYVETQENDLINVITSPTDFSIKIGKGQWKHYKDQIKVDKDHVHVIPQPAGSLYSFITKPDGTPTKDATDVLCSNVLILDIGMKTCDFYGIKNRAIVCKESIDDIGMSIVFQEISNMIREESGEDIRTTALQNNLETGYYVFVNDDTMESEEKSIAPLLEEANKIVMKKAMEKAKITSNAFRGYKYLVITGGTGEAWAEGIKEWLKGMKALNVELSNKACGADATFPLMYQNTRGYYFFRYMLDKKKKVK